MCLQHVGTCLRGYCFKLEVCFVTVTIDLKAKLPLQDSGPYIITVTNVDTCEHTSSVTVTIGTYNAVSTR